MNEREKIKQTLRDLEGSRRRIKIAKAETDEKIAAAQQQLADLDAREAMLWKPTTGEEYYFDLFSESLGKSLWSDRGVDHYRWSLGNVYRTRDDAVSDKRLRLIDVRIKRAAKSSGEIDEHWWSITMSDGQGVEAWARHNWHCGEPRFTTEESCQACIDDIGKEDISFWLEDGQCYS